MAILPPNPHSNNTVAKAIALIVLAILGGGGGLAILGGPSRVEFDALKSEVAKVKELKTEELKLMYQLDGKLEGLLRQRSAKP